jgi:hypothetical protein
MRAEQRHDVLLPLPQADQRVGRAIDPVRRRPQESLWPDLRATSRTAVGGKGQASRSRSAAAKGATRRAANGASVNAVVLRGASSMRRTTPVGEHKRVALRIYTALAEMCAERARESEWRDLADCCNIVEALVELGKYEAEKVVPHLELAKAGLVVAMKCADGQMRMGREQLMALRHIVTLHDEAIAKFSIATMFEADLRVISTVRRVLGGDEAGATIVSC